MAEQDISDDAEICGSLTSTSGWCMTSASRPSCSPVNSLRTYTQAIWRSIESAGFISAGFISLIDWVGFNVPLNTFIGHIRDGFLWVKWPNQQCQSTEGSSSSKDRLQSHQVHLTMLQTYTCIQYIIIHIIHAKINHSSHCWQTIHNLWRAIHSLFGAKSDWPETKSNCL